MTVAITCDCGEQVAFDVTNSEKAPVFASCDCGEIWKLDISRLPHLKRTA